MLFLFLDALDPDGTVRANDLTYAASGTAFLILHKNGRGSVNPQFVRPYENTGRTFLFAKPAAFAQLGKEMKYRLIPFFGHYVILAQIISLPFNRF